MAADDFFMAVHTGWWVASLKQVLTALSASAIGVVLAAFSMLCFFFLASIIPHHSATVVSTSDKWHENLHRKLRYPSKRLLFGIYSEINDSILTALKVLRDVIMGHGERWSLGIRKSKDLIALLCLLGAAATLSWQFFAPQLFNVTYRTCGLGAEGFRTHVRKGAINALATLAARVGDNATFSGRLADETLMSTYDLTLDPSRFNRDGPPAPSALSFSTPQLICNRLYPETTDRFVCNLVTHINRDGVELPWGLDMAEGYAAGEGMQLGGTYGLEIYGKNMVNYVGVPVNNPFDTSIFCKRHALMFNRTYTMIARGGRNFSNYASCEGYAHPNTLYVLPYAAGDAQGVLHIVHLPPHDEWLGPDETVIPREAEVPTTPESIGAEIANVYGGGPYSSEWKHSILAWNDTELQINVNDIATAGRKTWSATMHSAGPVGDGLYCNVMTTFRIATNVSGSRFDTFASYIWDQRYPGLSSSGISGVLATNSTGAFVNIQYLGDETPLDTREKDASPSAPYQNLDDYIFVLLKRDKRLAAIRPLMKSLQVPSGIFLDLALADAIPEEQAERCKVYQIRDKDNVIRTWQLFLLVFVIVLGSLVRWLLTRNTGGSKIVALYSEVITDVNGIMPGQDVKVDDIGFEVRRVAKKSSSDWVRRTR